MIKLFSFLLLSVLLLTTSAKAFAAPNNANKAENNPQIVAYYPYGLHAIPKDPIQYVYGTDLVMKRGNSGQIEAWYTGNDGHGFHSVWNNAKNGACSDNAVIIKDAYPSWGDYLTPGQDYCVKVNSF